MSKHKYGFENLKVASPCHESWDKMTGDEKVRFCGACERPVYNLSSLTGPEIAKVIKDTEGPRKCVRFYRRKDGTILTQDCPVGHRRARRKAVGVVATAFASVFGGLFLSDILQKEKQIEHQLIMGEMMLPPDEIDEMVMGKMVAPEALDAE